MTKAAAPKCMFCGQRKRSEAHAWPKKYSKYVLRQAPPGTMMRGRAGSGDVVWQNRLTHFADVKTDRVCARCNSGFMTQVEDRAWPILLRLMEASKPVTLTCQEQTLLASWATYFTMVYELCDDPSKPIHFSYEQRWWFRQTHLVPRDTVIWIGCYIGRGAGRGHVVDQHGQIATGNDVKANVTTFTVGPVALQVVTARWLDDAAGGYGPLVPMPSGSPLTDIPIWPLVGPVTWPPKKCFDDGRLKQWAYRWSGLPEPSKEADSMPDENVYRQRVVRITNLVDRDGVLDGVTFEGCHIDGPAILALQGMTTLFKCNYGGTVDVVLWEVPLTRERVTGLVIVKDCTFDNCVFYNVGFAGPPEVMKKFRESAS